MISVKVTENLVGIEIRGDYYDLVELHSAIGDIVGDEVKNKNLENIRIMILSLNYDIRHAFQGDREIELIDNNMDDFRMEWHGKTTPKENLYYKFNILIPYILFIIPAVEKFILKYIKEKKININESKYIKIISVYRSFSSKVMEAFKKTFGKSKYNEMLNLVNNSDIKEKYFLFQYLDQLCIDYINNTKTKRKSLIVEMTDKVLNYENYQEYINIREKIYDFAKKNDCDVDNVIINEFPEDINWED